MVARQDEQVATWGVDDDDGALTVLEYGLVGLLCDWTCRVPCCECRLACSESEWGMTCEWNCRDRASILIKSHCPPWV